MELVAYLRVSTRGQVDAYGLDSQRDAITRWAEAEGHTIAAEEQDAITGTSEFKDRLGWATAEARVKRHEVAGIVVAKLDRLSRDVIVQETFIRNASASGVQVFSSIADENALLTGDPKDPTRKLVRTIMGAIVEYDRDMITMRLLAGRKAKASAGGYAHGALPYGYNSIDAVLVPVKVEQEALAKMRALSAQGVSTREIARVLTAEGYPTKRGGQWSSPTVARILKRAPRNSQEAS